MYLAAGRTAALKSWRRQYRSVPETGVHTTVMTILDLLKATLICGGFAYLIYSFPLLGQIVLIGFLGLLWLAYARKTLSNLLRR
jgi:hypothetical protein